MEQKISKNFQGTGLEAEVKELLKDIEWEQMRSRPSEVNNLSAFVEESNKVCQTIVDLSGPCESTDIKMWYAQALMGRVVDHLWHDLGMDLQERVMNVRVEPIILSSLPEDKDNLLVEAREASREVALEKGVLLPEIEWREGPRELSWHGKRLGTLYSTDAVELAELLKQKAYLFLDLKALEPRLNAIWRERPDLKRAADGGGLGSIAFLNISTYLLQAGGSIKDLDVVVELIIRNRGNNPHVWSQGVLDDFCDIFGEVETSSGAEEPKPAEERVKGLGSRKMLGFLYVLLAIGNLGIIGMELSGEPLLQVMLLLGSIALGRAVYLHKKPIVDAAPNHIR